MGHFPRAFAALLVLALAGCNITGHVSKEREPRFVPPAQTASMARMPSGEASR